MVLHRSCFHVGYFLVGSSGGCPKTLVCDFYKRKNATELVETPVSGSSAEAQRKVGASV